MIHEVDEPMYSNESLQSQHNRNYREEAQPERSKQHGKQPSHKHGMMQNQVRYMSGLVRHGMAKQSAQTILQIKWSSICNELHIDETPHSNI